MKQSHEDEISHYKKMVADVTSRLKNRIDSERSDAVAPSS